MHRFAIELFFLFSILFSCQNSANAQDTVINKKNIFCTNWYLTLNAGVQMSGIKDEDFVKSNFSPLNNFEIGKCVTRSLSLQIGYRGWYFNLINDNYKHFYGYYFGETVFNLNELVSLHEYKKRWSVSLLIGAGLLYNYDYKRPNICDSFSITNNYRFSKRIVGNIRVSSIMGWDIYQGDEDILPGLSVGVTYYL